MSQHAREQGYQFFSNHQCEYYPCHETKEPINCLFCYCPLYLKENCGGNYSHIVGRDGSLIKDCSNCLFPHIKDNYNKVIAALMEKEEQIFVSCEELKEAAFVQLSANSGFAQMEEEEKQRQMSVAQKIYDIFFAKAQMQVLLKPFAESCVKDGYFQFGQERINCTVLQRIVHETVVKGYFYACCGTENIEYQEELDLLQQYYKENWHMALLDSLRQWIRNYITRKESVRSSCYVTDSFGPGFYGMPLEAVNQLSHFISLNKIGVEIQENGSMRPLKSLMGLYLVTTKKPDWPMYDCGNCIGAEIGCTFCSKNVK